MSDRYYLTDGSHALIAGPTGAGDRYGGKSSTANWWFHNAVRKGWFDAGLYFNANAATKGARVSSLKGLAESYRSGKRAFAFDPHLGPGETEQLTEYHESVMETLRNIGGNWIVVHEEAQKYGDSAYLDWMLEEAGNRGDGFEARSLVVSQRAWNLSDRQRNNLPLKVWVGPMNTEGRNYFQSENMGPVADEIAENTDRYRWSVTDGGEYVETNPPVPEDYA